ncbi:hypothetical protein PIB30_092142 [Stylosanthes scabra]|uniref:Uncharacterized protein n=1 Tax=Stylosanthes scabra TaxID=79078 RepID=A0ABU6RUQ1_9FABA|nr:hypothetical protein [Stylosanthes scabra]
MADITEVVVAYGKMVVFVFAKLCGAVAIVATLLTMAASTSSKSKQEEKVEEKEESCGFLHSQCRDHNSRHPIDPMPKPAVAAHPLLLQCHTHVTLTQKKRPNAAPRAHGTTLFFVTLPLPAALEQGMSLVKDVHQGLSKQMMEETYSYDQGYTPWNPPPYQHHAPQYNVHHSNGFGNAYYGYEDPPPSYPPSQGNFEDIFQVLLQERKEFRETQNSNICHPSNFGDDENLNHKKVHECLEEVEEENVYQEVADEDKESKGMEIIQSASFEATPPESPSKLHFEWVNLSDMNLLSPQHYALLEMDDQLRVICGLLDKKEMDSLGMDESRFITCRESEFESYSGHLHKLHNNRAKVGALNLRKHLGPWQSQEKLVDSQSNG